jgi:hypothetical protein
MVRSCVEDVYVLRAGCAAPHRFALRKSRDYTDRKRKPAHVEFHERNFLRIGRRILDRRSN